MASQTVLVTTSAEKLDAWPLVHALSPCRCAREYTAAPRPAGSCGGAVFASVRGAPLYSLSAGGAPGSACPPTLGPRCRSHERRHHHLPRRLGAARSRRRCSPTARSPWPASASSAVGPAADVIAAHPGAPPSSTSAAPSSCPGFVNCHSHIEYTSFRGILDDDEFGDWIISLVDVKASLTPEEYLRQRAPRRARGHLLGHHHDRRHELRRR